MLAMLNITYTNENILITNKNIILNNINKSIFFFVNYFKSLNVQESYFKKMTLKTIC